MCPDRRLVAMTDQRIEREHPTKTVRIWDRERARSWAHRHRSRPGKRFFDPIGTSMSRADNSRESEVWESANGGRVASLGGRPLAGDVISSPDGCSVATVHIERHDASWDPGTGVQPLVFD
jgi:hypothetical protein